MMDIAERLVDGRSADARREHYYRMLTSILWNMSMKQTHWGPGNIPMEQAQLKKYQLANYNYEVTEEEFGRLLSILGKMSRRYPGFLSLNPSVQFDRPLDTIVGTYDTARLPVENEFREHLEENLKNEFS
jgi:hypothetical protein